MVARPPSDYTARFVQAVQDAGRDPFSSKDVGWLADKLNISYQAMKKVISGDTRMMAADNNVKAAMLLGVNSEWLATGEGPQRIGAHWPLSRELLKAVAAAPEHVKRQAENAARNVLDMDPLPRDLGGASTPPAERNPHGKLAA